MKKRILLIGNPEIELGLTATEFAQAGQTVSGNFEETFTPGGALGYAGTAISRLGGEAILCGRVGGDSHGKETLEFYRQLGMDARFVEVDKTAKTPISLYLRAAGAEEVYRHTGLCASITPDLVEDAFTTEPDAVYVSMDIPADAALLAARLAREKKIPAFFDGEIFARDFPLEELGEVSLIALSPQMTLRHTGIEPRDVQSNLRAAVELSKTVKAKTYVFKFGVGGAFAYKGNFSYYVPYVENADPRFTKLLIPAMIVENLRSNKSVRALRYASTVIERAAAQGDAPLLSIPSETDVLRYILEHEVEL